MLVYDSPHMYRCLLFFPPYSGIRWWYLQWHCDFMHAWLYCTVCRSCYMQHIEH
jgi:hypothetical protein